MAQAILALGSNIGDRKANLHEAIRRLGQADLRPARVSSLYETDPVGPAAGPAPFLNMALIATTTLIAREVLDTCLGIERAMGRERTVTGGPRLIDIDLLAWEQVIVRQTDFTLPHPRLHERRFVLEPLAEIAPAWIHPETGLTPGAMLDRLEDPHAVRRLAPEAEDAPTPEKTT